MSYITMDVLVLLPISWKIDSGSFTVAKRLLEMTRLISFGPTPDSPKPALVFKNHVSKPPDLAEKIVSDHDLVFVSNFWRSLFSNLVTKRSPSSACQPQTDSQSEIMSRKKEETTRFFVAFEMLNSDEYLVDSEVANNSSFNATTKFTPFYLSYGIHPGTISMELVSSLNPATNKFLRSVQKSTEEAQKVITRSNQSTTEYGNRKSLAL